jgi:hypothetical protein
LFCKKFLSFFYKKQATDGTLFPMKFISAFIPAAQVAMIKGYINKLLIIFNI